MSSEYIFFYLLFFLPIFNSISSFAYDMKSYI